MEWKARLYCTECRVHYFIVFIEAVVTLVTGKESIPNWRAPTYQITQITATEQGNAIATEDEYWDKAGS